MDRTDRRIWLARSAVSLAVAGLLVVRDARAQTTVGVHLLTAHSSHNTHTETAGVYVALPFGVAGAKTVLGAYRNSVQTPQRRISVYVAQAWQWGRWGLAAGVVSGYQKERVPVECSRGFANCWWEYGLTNAPLMPLVVPSVTFPEARRWIGVTPRLSLVGIKAPAIHLSLEVDL